MHARVSRGRRRKIDSLAAEIAIAEACLLLVLAGPLVAFGGVRPFLGAAPAAPAAVVVVVGVVGVGAEVALGIYGAGVVDERTVIRGGGGGPRAGAAGFPWSPSFVGAGEPPLAGELLVDGGSKNSAIGVGVEDSGVVVTILNDVVTEGDAGADSVVVAGRANCNTEASISGGLSACTSTVSDITGIGSVAAEPDAFSTDGPDSRRVFLISPDSAEPPLDEGTVRFVSIESSVDEAVFVVAVVFVVVLPTDDPVLFCRGGVVASGVGGCVRGLTVSSGCAWTKPR